MRSTSLEAYDYIKHQATPNIGQRCRIVLNAIRSSPYPLTDLEIAKKLGFNDPNCVRPRRYELVEMGLVEQASKRKCTISNRRAIVWRAKRPSIPRKTEEQLLYEGFAEDDLTIPNNRS